MDVWFGGKKFQQYNVVPPVENMSNNVHFIPIIERHVQWQKDSLFVWCLLGALLGCVGRLRPVNVAFALLIFILVFLLSFEWNRKQEFVRIP
jgi:hypothetical protein